MNKQLTETTVQVIYQFYKQFHDELAEKTKVPLSQVQFIALEYIHHQEKVRLKDLADYLSITPASTSTMVKKLEASGYLYRTPDETDGRAYNFALSEQGIATYQECYTEAGEHLETFLTRLSEVEEQQLVTLLRKMLADD